MWSVMMDNYGEGWGMQHHGAGWLMVLLMLVLVAAVVVAVVALLRGNVPVTPRPPAGVRRSEPRAILQDRFARGEIDESDYRARMRALDETGPAPG